MKALVTGGGGFIGSHLCDALLARGWDVVAIDNFITGRRSNLAHLQDNDRFTRIECDLELAPDVDCDVVYHLASPASPIGYGRHPFETLRVNSEGTWRALDIAATVGARFLLASTSEVYGDPLEHPQSEEYFGNVDAIGPRSCYDEGKRFAEALTTAFIKERRVDARIVRIFNCYGPRNAPDDGRMVPTFVVQALRGEPLTVYGTGAQTRSLCYVDDIVQGLMLCMDRSGNCGRVYNLGQPREHSVLEFAQQIVRATRSRSNIIHLQTREGEIERRRPDARRAMAELGWSADTSLEDGLRRTIDFMRGELATADVQDQEHAVPRYLRRPRHSQTPSQAWRV